MQSGKKAASGPDSYRIIDLCWLIEILFRDIDNAAIYEGSGVAESVWLCDLVVIGSLNFARCINFIIFSCVK